MKRAAIITVLLIAAVAVTTGVAYHNSHKNMSVASTTLKNQLPVNVEAAAYEAFLGNEDANQATLLTELATVADAVANGQVPDTTNFQFVETVEPVAGEQANVHQVSIKGAEIRLGLLSGTDAAITDLDAVASSAPLSVASGRFFIVEAAPKASGAGTFDIGGFQAPLSQDLSVLPKGAQDALGKIQASLSEKGPALFSIKELGINPELFAAGGLWFGNQGAFMFAVAREQSEIGQAPHIVVVQQKAASEGYVASVVKGVPSESQMQSFTRTHLTGAGDAAHVRRVQWTKVTDMLPTVAIAPSDISALSASAPPVLTGAASAAPARAASTGVAQPVVTRVELTPTQLQAAYAEIKKNLGRLGAAAPASPDSIGDVQELINAFTMSPTSPRGPVVVHAKVEPAAAPGQTSSLLINRERGVIEEQAKAYVKFSELPVSDENRIAVEAEDTGAYSTQSGIYASEEDVAIASKLGMNFEITFMAPAMVGTEFVGTKGQYMGPMTKPVVVQVLTGQAIILLQGHEGSKKIPGANAKEPIQGITETPVTDAVIILADAGQSVAIPAGWGFKVINPASDQLLATAAWVPLGALNNETAATSDVYTERDGAAYYITKPSAEESEIEVVPNWEGYIGSTPKLFFASAKATDLRILGAGPNMPLYDAIASKRDRAQLAGYLQTGSIDVSSNVALAQQYTGEARDAFQAAAIAASDGPAEQLVETTGNDEAAEDLLVLDIPEGVVPSQSNFNPSPTDFADALDVTVTVNLKAAGAGNIQTIYATLPGRVRPLTVTSVDAIGRATTTAGEDIDTAEAWGAAELEAGDALRLAGGVAYVGTPPTAPAEDIAQVMKEVRAGFSQPITTQENEAFVRGLNDGRQVLRVPLLTQEAAYGLVVRPQGSAYRGLALTTQEQQALPLAATPSASAIDINALGTMIQAEDGTYTFVPNGNLINLLLLRNSLDQSFTLNVFSVDADVTSQVMQDALGAYGAHVFTSFIQAGTVGEVVDTIVAAQEQIEADHVVVVLSEYTLRNATEDIYGNLPEAINLIMVRQPTPGQYTSYKAIILRSLDLLSGRGILPEATIVDIKAEVDGAPEWMLRQTYEVAPEADQDEEEVISQQRVLIHV